MWATLLLMAIAVSVEPFRIGMVLVMLNRPRPLQQLIAFLCGGFAMGLSVGLVVVLVLRRTLETSPSVLNFVTVPNAQLVIGLMALLVAAALGVGSPERLWSRRTQDRHAIAESGSAEETRTGITLTKTRGANRHSLWFAGLAGSAIALPSVDYLAALAVIVASGASTAEQFGALVAFNAVAFVLVELPLVGHLVAPERTRAVMEAINDWIRSRRRRDVAVAVAVMGCVMLALGLTGS